MLITQTSQTSHNRISTGRAARPDAARKSKAPALPVLREFRLLLDADGKSLPCLDDPYEFLEHLPALFAAIVGRRDE
jgi:hypothetical protein